ncbi:hypothetical protein PRIPAC_72083 [Pristionchus pacificus]|uniref:Zinc finger protein n=1 Tax=Pristionchus pacificus TaxID=54126 RepID=A0A2A6CA52_PRIPA|nr:hypothetical protein PRIPAC_72083 [Pristionchus pacificus]|eukprot:PDM74933.1 zinc finger protein [Pristionchus pacificus]
MVHSVSSRENRGKRVILPLAYSSLFREKSAVGTKVTFAAENKGIFLADTLCDQMEISFYANGPNIQTHDEERHAIINDEQIYSSRANLLPKGAQENESQDIKRWMCPLCGKIFYSRKSVLNRHIIQVHSKYYPHVCECGHAYKRKDHLKRHWRCRPDNYTLHYTQAVKVVELAAIYKS